MLNFPPFYFAHIKQYTATIGAIFDNIQIQNFGAANAVNDTINVPVMYAPRDKMLARVNQDPNIDRPSATVPLPCISFEMGQIAYDPERKRPKTLQNAYSANSEIALFQYVSNPYNFQYRVHIYGKNMEDVLKIIEQVLPFFTPDFTLRFNLMPQLHNTYDCPLILESIEYEDTFEGDLLNRRSVYFTLNFVLKAHLFQPISTTVPIKFIDVQLFIANTTPTKNSVGQVPVVAQIITEPGMDANGNPTSNLAVTVPYNQISVNSDYGFCVNTYEGNINILANTSGY